MKPLCSLWPALALLLALSAQADFQAGLEALAVRDYAAALQNLKPLAEQGNAAAQVNLGNLYMKGWGVEQDYHAARRWYQRAADQGERMAQSKLGILYYHGLGVPKDSIEASKWFQQAAEQGMASAQSVLAALYAEGDGVRQDLARAFYWYTLAAEQGDAEAAKGRKSLEEDMTPGQRDEALRLLAESRKARSEQDEKAFEAATVGLGPPPAADKPTPATPHAAGRREKKRAAPKPAP